MDERNDVIANEDTSQDESIGCRRVLGDVTIFYGKRGYLSIRGDSTLEDGSGHGKGGHEEFWHRVCKGVEDSGKERGNARPALISSETVGSGDNSSFSVSEAKRLCQSTNLSSGGDGSAQNDATLSVSQVPPELHGLPSSLNCSLHLKRCSHDSSPVIGGNFEGDHQKISAGTIQNAVEIDDVSEAPVIYAHDTSNKGKHAKSGGQFFISSTSNLQCLGSQESKTGGGEAPLSKPSYVQCLRGSGSSGSLMFGSDTHPKLHATCSGEKACSCAFCLKDLHYQDATDRLTALKKSKKLVKQLVGSFNHSEAAKVAHEDSDKSDKMESDLMNRWMSLFLHTGDLLTLETNEVQSEHLKWKGVRGTSRCLKGHLQINHKMLFMMTEHA